MHWCGWCWLQRWLQQESSGSAAHVLRNPAHVLARSQLSASGATLNAPCFSVQEQQVLPLEVESLNCGGYSVCSVAAAFLPFAAGAA